MIAPTSPLARWGRALVVGAWATVGAVGAHGSTGGAPPLLAVLPVAVAAVLVAHLLTGRRLTAPLLLLLLALPQLAVHALASYLHGHAATDLLTAPPAMVAAHLVGLVVVAAGLAHGERLWWEWWTRATLVVRLLLTTTAPVGVPLAVTGTTTRAATPLLDHVVVRRGPPDP